MKTSSLPRWGDRERRERVTERSKIDLKCIAIISGRFTLILQKKIQEFAANAIINQMCKSTGAKNEEE